MVFNISPMPYFLEKNTKSVAPMGYWQILLDPVSVFPNNSLYIQKLCSEHQIPGMCRYCLADILYAMSM